MCINEAKIYNFCSPQNDSDPLSERERQCHQERLPTSATFSCTNELMGRCTRVIKFDLMASFYDFLRSYKHAGSRIGLSS